MMSRAQEDFCRCTTLSIPQLTSQGNGKIHKLVWISTISLKKTTGEIQWILLIKSYQPFRCNPCWFSKILTDRSITGKAF